MTYEELVAENTRLRAENARLDKEREFFRVACANNGRLGASAYAVVEAARAFYARYNGEPDASAERALFEAVAAYEAQQEKP
jgi:hypothetical protein